MKKLLGPILSLASIGFVASAAEAKSANSVTSAKAIASSVAPQWQGRNRRGRFNSHIRVVTQTRLVRRGRQLFRETYQVRYLPNGRVQTTLINRFRVR